MVTVVTEENTYTRLKMEIEEGTKWSISGNYLYITDDNNKILATFNNWKYVLSGKEVEK